MKIKHKQASILAVLGSLYSLLGTYIIFINHWQAAHFAKNSQDRPDETVIVKWIYPALTDIAMVGAVVLLISAFLHHREHKWAWGTSMVGILLMVQGTVFPVVGSASAGIFPMYVYLAVPNLTLFFLFLRYIRKVDGRIVALATLVGLTYTVCLFNGIAGASRAFQHGGVEGIHLFSGEVGSPAKFVASMRLSWFASALWISFMMALLLKKSKDILLMASTAATVFALFGGVLLALDTILAERIFSMFALAPMFSLIILGYLALPGSTKTIEKWRSSEN